MLKCFSEQLNGKSSFAFTEGFILLVVETCHRSLTKAFVYSWKSMMNLVVILILLSVEKIMHTKRNKSPLCFHSLMASYFRMTYLGKKKRQYKRSKGQRSNNLV